MRKVVHIIVGLNVGGAELMLKRLIESHKGNSEIQHVVVSLTDLGVLGEGLIESGVQVYCLRIQSLVSVIKSFFKLRVLIRELSPDVIHTWMYHADLVGGLAARSVGIEKVVWGVRTTDLGAGTSRITRFVRLLCAILSWFVPSVIVFAAEESRKKHRDLGYCSRKMQVIPNGYYIDHWVASSGKRHEIRAAIGVDESAILVGSVGRFNHDKDPLEFVRLAKMLANSFENAFFIMIGRGNDWDNVELSSWLHAAGLEDRFILMGQRQNVADLFSAMDVFCLHSRTEAFPNVLCEALLVGVSCVAYDVGDSRYILAGTDNVVVPRGHLSKLYEAVSFLIRRRRDNAAIAHNRSIIAARYSMESISNEYLSIYCD